VTVNLLDPCLPLPSHQVSVQAQEGDTVELPCKVEEQGTRIVSWLQVEGLHIISAGRYTFTADPRFTADYRAASEVWILRIRKLKLEDAGDYECQLSGDPPTTQTITLVVHGKREEEVIEETVLQKVMVVEEEEEVVAKVAKVVQRTRSSNVDKDKQENSREATLGGSSIVMAGGCLVVVVVCLLSLGAVRQCLGSEARAGERPMPCAKSTQVRRQRSTSRRRRATTSREAEVVGDNSKIEVSRSREAEKNDFPEIPEWQSAAADVQLRPRVDELRPGSGSAENGRIQNVWDR